MSKKKTEKIIVFNETIDNAINGYAASFTFIILAIFLLNNLNYFGDKKIATISWVVLFVMGIVGSFVELGKLKYIKGFDDIGIGLLFFVPWLFIYFLSNSICVNSIGFILLILGVYGIILGIIKIVVSLFYLSSKEENKFKYVGKNIIKAIPAFVNLIFIVFSTLKIIFEIKGII